MAETKYYIQVEEGTFTDDTTKKEIKFKKYYVEWQGVKIYLKPADATSKQILGNLI